nr:MAG TPA: cytochrome C6 [Caudoviricetes sp.]
MKTSYSANCMMMPMMRMFSMCMLCHGENGHFLSETV